MLMTTCTTAPISAGACPNAPAYGGQHRAGVILLSSVLAAIVGALLLSYSSFCLGTFPFLSDEEAINAAVDDILRSGIHVIETPTGGYMPFRPKRQVRYPDRNEFRRLNPRCCTIVAHDRVWIKFRHQLFGQFPELDPLRDGVWGLAKTHIDERFNVSDGRRFASEIAP
jgi:hypothetical protein